MKKKSDKLRETFNRLFVRQKDEFSCGPACLTTVANIYQIKNVGYDTLREMLTPDPAVGVPNSKITEVSKAFLPFESEGEHCYKGGIAITSVTEKSEDEDEGHFILLLRRKGNDVIYYDPYDHKIKITPLKKLNWVSKAENQKEWVVNFKPLPNNSFRHWKKFIP